ncbi:MAG: hypothetical protein ACP5MH_06055 [Thermoproteus sp.]
MFCPIYINAAGFVAGMLGRCFADSAGLEISPQLFGTFDIDGVKNASALNDVYKYFVSVYLPK